MWFRAFVLASIVALAGPATAEEPDYHPSRPACAADRLDGEWRAADGFAVRFSGPYGLRKGRAVVTNPGPRPVEVGQVMYLGARPVADFAFLAHRELMLNLNLHPAPPHVVALEFDPEAGTLTDDYQGEILVFTRVGP